MRPTLVLNVVGLTPGLIGPHTPNLRRLAERSGARPIETVVPAVTCPVQATFLTGLLPRDHGIVGNGWYFRDLSEVWFWRQSGRLVSGERIWDAGRRLDPAFTCANLFWWYNMHSGADIGATPRPIYTADGLKIPDCYTEPAELRDELTRRLGPFPLFQFWGPATDIRSSAWIAECARHVRATRRPTLTLVYLPHLDYALQRLGPRDPALAKDLREIDDVVGDLIEAAEADGMAAIVLSEYGIVPVSTPIHVNRALRRAGHLRVRDEMGRELLDAGASPAFAVADHQIAHIYLNDPKRANEVAALLADLPGVDRVLGADGKAELGLDHPRAGDLVALAEPDAWFTYYHWLDDGRAPDFARTVEIHRKPGYDPVELFLDPALKAPRAAIGWRLLRRRLGFRVLMDVIPLDATLVRGSHGVPTAPEDGPVFLTSEPDRLPEGPIHATAVRDLILRHVFPAIPAESYSMMSDAR